jgi:uncharacterized membrane protein YqjE
MPEYQGNHTGQSIHGLLGDAMRETTDLARKEMTLFRTEMSENIKGLVIGLVMFVAAAVFAIACIMLLTEALVEWLARVVNSEALAALIVAAVMGAIAIGFALYGRSKMAASSLTPNRTVRSVRRDAEVLSERVSG